MLKAFRIVLLSTGLILLFCYVAGAQDRDYDNREPARTVNEVPPTDIIDAPTAGTLPRGCFDMVMRVYSNGGILGKTSIGLSNRFMLGMSYGAEGIISDRSTNRNPRIEFNIKLRLIDEDAYLPAIAIGYNSQGYGAYIDSMERYTFKSKGFYAVMSRSFDFYGSTAGGHVGVNYSLENNVDHEEEPSVFFGLDTRFNNNIGILLEYDMGLNDNRASQGFAKGRGYFNMGIKWIYSENLELEIVLKDMLINRKVGATTFGRELRFTYIEFF